MTFAIGKTSAVGLVMWSIIASRVRGVTAARIASMICISSRSGKGTLATTTFAPTRDAASTSTLRQAL